MADTTPDKVDPTTVEGYEPPIEGEDRKQARARRARNRRRAEKVQREHTADTEGPKPVGRPSKAGKREQAVTGVLTGAGIAVMAFDQFDGQTIIEGAPDLAKALAALAEKRPAVAKALDALTETSAWAEVGVAAAAIVVPIVTHHRQLSIERAAEADARDAAPGANSGTRPAQAGASTPPAPAAPPDGPTVAAGVSEDAPVFTVTAPDPTDAVPTFRA